jgi:hypothetical protein
MILINTKKITFCNFDKKTNTNFDQNTKQIPHPPLHPYLHTHIPTYPHTHSPMSDDKYANPYTVEDGDENFIHHAARNRDFGDIHFGPDPRFISTMDQTRWCFVLFNNYNRCVEKLGEDAERCKYLHQKYRAVTPGPMQERWAEELDEGRFAGYTPGREPPVITVDYSLRPSRTRHLEQHHDHDDDHHH